ncbi:MAG: hypothetical protein RBR16_06955 [Syntrophus sp. (in: bacteria)]|nr:hypothetical protein [Syntrophus sp. (in: bacteria)]
MNIDVEPKKIHKLFPTDILFQTTYWGQVKSRLGWTPLAFDFHASTGQSCDLMVLVKNIAHDFTAACVPQGPENGPDPEKYGIATAPGIIHSEGADTAPSAIMKHRG